MLRWREILPGGRSGRRRKWAVVDQAGRPVPSRNAAHSYAVAKSDELVREKLALAEVAATDDFRPDATWAQLCEEHFKYLERKGRRPSTKRVYKEVWPFLNNWRGRPELPKHTTLRSIEEYVAYVSKQLNRRTQLPLSPNYVESIVRHTRCILNFGRKRLRCVRLDAETLAEGLQAPVKVRVTPNALTSRQMCDLLRVSMDYDENHLSNTFPVLAAFLCTGCRRGELEALRWSPSTPGAPESWVDFDGERVLIYGAKTSRHRVLPFKERPLLRKILKSMQQQVDLNQHPFVFGGSKAASINSKRHQTVQGACGVSFREALVEIRKQCGFEWMVKDLRSTAATMLANSLLGANLYQVAGWMGHRFEVLNKHYAGHITLPPRQHAARTVEGVLGIAKVLTSWLDARVEKKGRLLHLRQERA